MITPVCNLSQLWVSPSSNRYLFDSTKKKEIRRNKAHTKEEEEKKEFLMQ
jgi:hypothetical protein